jgi:hypothetical protein
MRGGSPLSVDDTYLWIVLLIAAYIDFVHDFNDSSRTSISVELLKSDPYGVVPPRVKFLGIEKILQGMGGKSASAFYAFRDIVSAGLLTLLNGVAIPPSLSGNIESIKTKAILHETDILDLIKLEYSTFISGLPQTIYPPDLLNPRDARVQMSGAGRPAGKLEVSFGEGASERKIEYTATSYPTKLRGENKAHVHTTEAFHCVSGGRNVFVCMIDAASCSMDIIGDPWTFGGKKDRSGNPLIDHLSFMGVGYLSTRDYHIFVLNSKENISDPAGKSTIRNRVLPLQVHPDQKNVFVYFLEEADPNHVSVFPTGFENIVDPVQKENQSVFTPFTVETRRTGTVAAPTVSAIAKTSAGTFAMNDVGTDSEVRSAVQRALTQTLLGSPPEEVFLNFMMKRFGDWCQALCLKDTTRRYRVVFINRSSTPDARFNPLYKEGDVVSLDDLQTIHKALIFLLTIDRVLLAFALALGINVIFTSKSGVIGTSWMTLFETGVAADNVSDAPALYDKLVNLDQMIRAQGVYVQSVIDRVNKLQDPIVSMNFNQYAVSLLALRDTLSVLSFLPTIPTLKKHLIKVTEDHEEDARFSFLVEFAKFTVDDANNPFGSIPATIDEVPEPDRNQYQKTVNEFRSFVETVEKNQALIVRYAAGQPPRSAEQVKEDGKVDMFFKTLAANPSVISSRHPLFKSVEQTLQSIISNAKLTGINLTPPADVSTAWDKAHPAMKQFVPRQSGRAGAVVQPPLQELFSGYLAAAAAGGGQRGGRRLEEILESPLTEMVYVIYLPKPVLQIDDIEGVVNVGALSQLKYAEARQLLEQLVAARTSAGDEDAAKTLATTENINELTAELMSEFVRTGVYGGKISNDQGHLASVIDPYVFFGGLYLKEFLLEDPPQPVDSPPNDQLVYMSLRYILWKTDELYRAVEKLNSANPENDGDLTAYDALVDELNALELLIDRQMINVALGPDEQRQDFNTVLRTFISDVRLFAEGVPEDDDDDDDDDDEDEKDVSNIRGELEAIDPLNNIKTISEYMTNFPVGNPIRSVWDTQALPELETTMAAVVQTVGSVDHARLIEHYFNTLEAFVNFAITNGERTFADDLRLYARKVAFGDYINGEDGVIDKLKEIRRQVYIAYEYIDTQVPSFPLHRIAYPSANFRGGRRRKTHRRRGLPKLI